MVATERLGRETDRVGASEQESALGGLRSCRS